MFAFYLGRFSEFSPSLRKEIEDSTFSLLEKAYVFIKSVYKRYKDTN